MIFGRNEKKIPLVVHENLYLAYLACCQGIFSDDPIQSRVTKNAPIQHIHCVHDYYSINWTAGHKRKKINRLVMMGSSEYKYL